MDLVTGAMGSLISKLGKLLQDEYNLHKGSKKQIRSLSLELESAHAALRKIGQVPPDKLDENVRIWAREVREASYDMEDVLDAAFIVDVEGGSDHDESLFQRLLDKVGNLAARRKIAGAIDDINKRLEEVTERHRRYTVDSIIVAAPATQSSTAELPRLAAMYKEATQLVGIDDPRGELMSMLSSSSDENLKIVSVVGVGGLGKTTLAKAVYDELKSKFSCGAFVPVGRNPDLKKVFRDILIDLDKEKYTDIRFTVLDERQLINELRDFLRTKRYFIVIDDIWEKKSWQTIKFALAENNNRSRIITTTRKLEVAMEATEIYKLQPLPYDKSKKLFCTRIFGGEDKCFNNKLDEVLDKILRKCGGVPLAIISMTSLLAGKSREEWLDVCNSISFHVKENNQEDDIMSILSLSYYDLPPHLKACLLYLSAFPEDYFIEKGSLIWMLIAEGFIHKEQENSLFEAGKRYLDDLVNRSMIQALELERVNTTVEGYCLHDMVLDLLRFKAQEENFVTISNNDEDTLSQSRVRRLAHQNRRVEQINQDSQTDVQHVRSLIVCKCVIDTWFSLPSFRLLRVLALEHCRLMEGCVRWGQLENLVHLRYLGLRHTYFRELPNEIGALKFLQTLDLEDTSVQELPSGIGRLTRLICLRARNTMAPNGVIEKLMCLEELQIQAGKDTIGKFAEDLGKLSELRVLKAMFVVNVIEWDTHSDLVESIGNLPKLQHLSLGGYFTNPHKVIWDRAALPHCLRHLIIPCMKFSTLPPCINFSDLPNLSHLDLFVCSMDEEDLKILGGFPELLHLKLITWSTVTVTSIAADGFFQKLRFCNLASSMVQFVANEDASVSFTIWDGKDTMAFGSKKKDEQAIAPAIMRNLQELEFIVHLESLKRDKGSCDNLGLEYLTSLQKVKVHFMGLDAFADDVEEEEAALRDAIEVHPNRPRLQII